MSTLTAQDISEFKDGVRQVTDQFCITPITYKLAVESADRWGEDQNVSMAYTTYNLNGMVTYPSTGEETKVEGSLDKERVRVMINMADVIASYPALVDPVTKRVKMDKARDIMIVNGLTYKVTDIDHKGPLEQQNVLLFIEGDIQPTKS